MSKFIIEDSEIFRREIQKQVMEIIQRYAHQMPIGQFFEIDRCVDEAIAKKLGLMI